MARQEAFENQSNVTEATILANEGCRHNGGSTTIQETIEFHDVPPKNRGSSSRSGFARRPRACSCQRLCSDRLLIAAVFVIIVIWVLLVGFVVLFLVGPGDVNNAETTSNSSAENNCQGELYTGMMCTSILNAISEGCDITDSETASGGVYISTQGVDQTDTETQVLLLSNGLQFLDPSPECEEAFLPFLCLFAFPLCDSSGQLYQPSFTECETVTLVTCAREWQTAVLNLGSENLPQCSSLPDTTTQCDGISAINGSSTATIDSNSTELNCSKDFYFDSEGNICRADCAKWKLYNSDKLENAMITLIVLATIIGTIGGAVVLILSCINYKKAFAFPSAFVRYEVAIVMGYNVVILISAFNSRSLFCSTRDVFESSKESTPYCTFSGVVFYYIYLSISTLWILHIVAIFWGLMFPFQAHRFDVTDKNKYLHLTAIVLAIVVPGITTAISLGPEGVEFQRFPPLICAADNRHANFYASLLPGAVIDAVGFTLLILIFWIIYKNSKIADVAIKHTRTPEVKILIILCYFLFIGLFSIALFSSTFVNNFREFRENLSRYLLCESIGMTGDSNSCAEERSALDDQVMIQLLYDVAYILLGSFPAVNLIYAVNISDLKQKFRKHFPRLSRDAKTQETNFNFTTQNDL